ncbi:GHKL domain-containing protein [Sphingomonas parva]|uniref:histidine kinase n=1 Tax=Sphingomonas parva TaxID=2555898 RepID=A0A4Y8ZLP0_9SPHN|nr:ATP-binding protein [Sphingomonas parva]TFI56921.1 GHKL domain-containing protein [Sphingomonas parva]
MQASVNLAGGRVSSLAVRDEPAPQASRLATMFRSPRPLPIGGVILLVCLGTALLIALLWSAILAQSRFDRDGAIEAAIRENRNRVIAYEQYVTRTFDAANFAALHIATHSAAPLTHHGAGPALISDPVAANPLFAAVEIADARGDVRWSTVRGARPRNVAAEPGVRAIRAGARDRLMVSPPALSPTLGEPVLALTRAIEGADGSLVGTVSVEMPIARLTDFSQGATLRPLDLISVIGLDGITLARRSGGRISFGEDLRGKLVMAQQAKDPNGTYLGPSAIDGIVRYFSHRRLRDYPIFVTVGIGERDVLKTVTDRAWSYRIAGAALTAAFLLIAAFAIAGLARRERAARALAETNRRLREAQRLGRIGDWEYDLEAGRLIWSDQLCAMYGRDPADDVLSREDFLSYLDPTSRERFLSAVDAAVRSGQPQQCEIVALVGEGHAASRRLVLAPEPSADGAVRKVIGTDQDISDEKVSEQLREEVAHLSRIEAMNIMAVTIAHELAQPLTAAANYLSGAKIYARRSAPGDMDMVGEALVQVDRQIGLTREIMRRARDMLVKRPCAAKSAFLPEIVDDAVALVKIASESPDFEIVQEIAGERLHVAADKVQIQQVLMNLLRNACEAASAADQPRVVVRAETVRDGSIMVSVEDNGPGVTSELADIFSPFATSKSRGMGLGLSISRAIIQSFRGRIWISKSREGGAAICFTLPPALEAAA